MNTLEPLEILLECHETHLELIWKSVETPLEISGEPLKRLWILSEPSEAPENLSGNYLAVKQNNDHENVFIVVNSSCGIQMHGKQFCVKRKNGFQFFEGDDNFNDND